MSHALIVGSVVAEWPLTRARIAEIAKTAMEAAGAEEVAFTLPRLLDGLDLSEYGIERVAPSDPPSDLLPGQTVSEAEPALINGVWTQQWAIEGWLEEVKLALLTALADRRWRAEEGGTMLNGMALQTDRVSQAKLTGAYIKAQADAGYTIPNWKIAPGVFVTLDAATVIAAGDAVAAHVQACFDREAELSAEIEAAQDLAAVAAIDIEADWP